MAEQRTTDYLAAVRARLGLPEPWASEVREEVAAHLADAVQDGLANGLSADGAERAAIERLGPPEDLAAGLRAAHQTPRRLAAGIAGGATAALGGALGGTVIGYGLVIAIASVAILVGTLLGRATGIRLEVPGVPSTGWTAATAASAVAAGALLAARRATRAAALRSRRETRAIGRWLALAGTTALAAIVLFGARVVLSWPSVLAMVAIPVAFAAGALVATDRAGPRIGRRAVLVVFATCVAVPTLGLLALTTAVGTQVQSVGSGPYDSIDALWTAQGLDVVGRPAPASMADVFGDTGYRLEGGVATANLGIAKPALLAGWGDLRLEAWRTGSTDLVIQPGETAPFAAAPVEVQDGVVTGAVRVDATRDVEMFGLLLTGIGPDGVRSVLWGPNGGQTAFRGTVWDWLTAP